jgi:hypothetical protein
VGDPGDLGQQGETAYEAVEEGCASGRIKSNFRIFLAEMVVKKKGKVS